MSSFSLNDLEALIRARKDKPADNSYTASLLAKGPDHCARKMGEEAIELVVATCRGQSPEIIAETADLLYHLVVVLASQDIALEDVMAELKQRTAQSGLEEKASRKAR
jgi:phosphoribosyl-ATP pyrophosphohydrolase